MSNKLPTNPSKPFLPKKSFTNPKEGKKRVQKALEKIMSQEHILNDMAIYTKIVVSLTREEMSAMYRYHEIIRFISAIEVYDDVLFTIRKDKTMLGKNTFKKILAIRNKIAREHRNRTKKNEELFKLNKYKTKSQN